VNRFSLSVVIEGFPFVVALSLNSGLAFRRVATVPASFYR
jgi:hypothetical protein